MSKSCIRCHLSLWGNVGILGGVVIVGSEAHDKLGSNLMVVDDEGRERITT